MNTLLPKIVILGRPNVGKSTLANAFSEDQKVVTSKIPGTTRDFVELRSSWQGRNFLTVDTAGLISEEKDLLSKEIQVKIDEALEESALVLFVVDGKTGLTAFDREIAKKIRKKKKNTFIIVNKIDSLKYFKGEDSYRGLGFKKVFAVSALTGKGIGDVLQAIIEDKSVIKKMAASTDEQETTLTFALFGKVNVGKSSLLNSLLGKKRVLESPIPGTTIDINECAFTYHRKKLAVLDTAGIRHKAKVERQIEKESFEKTINLMRKIDVACLMIDGAERLSRQDLRIGQEIEEKFLPAIILVNKVDLLCPKEVLLHKPSQAARIFKIKKRELQAKFGMLDYAKIIFLSAKESFNLESLLETLLAIKQDLNKEIPKEDLTSFLKNFLEKYPAKSKRSKRSPKIYCLKQVSLDPPVFGLEVSAKGYLDKKYLIHLQREIRDFFRFVSRPVRVKIIKSKK